MKEILSNIRSLIIPISILMILISVSFLAVKLFFDKAAELNKNLGDTRVEQQVLTAKLLTLQTGTRIADLSQVSSIALPSQNSAFLMMSQIRRKAGELGLIIENVRSGQEVKEEGALYHVNISFEFDGLSGSAFDLLDRLSKVSPINILTRLKLSGTSGAPKIIIDLSSYWASFPIALPDIETAISDLTAEENKTLTKISNLEAPVFTSGATGETLSPSAPVVRLDPFSF